MLKNRRTRCPAPTGRSLPSLKISSGQTRLLCGKLGALGSLWGSGNPQPSTLHLESFYCRRKRRVTRGGHSRRGQGSLQPHQRVGGVERRRWSDSREVTRPSAECGEAARVSPGPLRRSGAPPGLDPAPQPTQRSDLIALGSLGISPPNRVTRLPTEGGQIPQGPTRHVHKRDARVPSALRRGRGQVGRGTPARAEAGCPSSVCHSLDEGFSCGLCCRCRDRAQERGSQERPGWVSPTACPPLRDRA